MANIGRLIVAIAFSIAILLSAFGLPVAANGSQNNGQSNPGGYVKYTLDLINNTLINGNFVNISNALGPVGVAYDPSNGYIYVINHDSNTVSVINGTTVIATITVGLKNPVGVAYDPSNGYIYVANFFSNTVSIISTSVSTSTSSISSVITSTTTSTSAPTTSTSTSVSTSTSSISSVITSTTSTSTMPTPSVVPTLVVVAAVVVVATVLVVALLMIKLRKP